MDDVVIERRDKKVFIKGKHMEEIWPTTTGADLAVCHDKLADESYQSHAFATTMAIAEYVVEDIRHHFAKYGHQRLDVANWWMVLGEEIGEAIMAINQRKFDEAKKEIRQTIACFIRLYVEVEREEAGIAASERSRYTKAV